MDDSKPAIPAAQVELKQAFRTVRGKRRDRHGWRLASLGRGRKYIDLYGSAIRNKLEAYVLERRESVSLKLAWIIKRVAEAEEMVMVLTRKVAVRDAAGVDLALVAARRAAGEDRDRAMGEFFAALEKKEELDYGRRRES